MGRVYFVGLDLGQKRDPTAMAVVEQNESALGLRHLERIALGTSYPEVVYRVGKLMRSRQLAGADGRHLVVDGTGVGPAVVDFLRMEDLRAQLWPVTITGGKRERRAGGYYRVPKRDLVVGLQVLMQQSGLQIAQGMKEGATLVREMSEMRVKVSGSRNEQFGAWRNGEHDDLVLAVALACWGVRKVGGRAMEPGMDMDSHG